MLVVLSITVILASLLVSGGYMYLSRDTYTAVKLSELKPHATALGQLFEEYKTGCLDKAAFSRLARALTEAAGASGVVLDAEGIAVYSDLNSKELSEEDLSILNAQLNRVLGGSGAAQGKLKKSNGEPALSISVPIYNKKGSQIGGVLLIKSMAEILTTIESLNNSLFLAIVVVLPIMLLISSLGMRKLTEPLHQMGMVAIKMSKGDFKVRADEDEVGEVGLLARALNNLCDTLSQTIYQLRAEKSQLNQILSSFTEGIAATDSTGALTHYNPALMRMFGAVIVNSRYELIFDKAIWEKFDEVYLLGETQSMRYPLQNERMLWVTISPVITEEGERTGVVGLFKDMTEMEHLERTRREYVANVSHELRTPLTAVRGLLEPLADGMVHSAEDRQRYYKIMLREVMRLSRLITDMMQLSRLQAGTEYMELVEADINEILGDIRLSYAKEAALHGIKLELSAPKLPNVLTDPSRVEQILIILLDNAMRYTPKGGTITLKGEDGASVTICVEDTGCGISQEDLPYVFDRFYKADKSRTDEGTGLGLSIAKHLIEKLGETISVSSRLGEGSCFSFTLKKYVSNAIALGPVQQVWQKGYIDGEEPVSNDSEQARPEAAASQDAPYEMLDSEKHTDKKRQTAEGGPKAASLTEKRQTGILKLRKH